MQKRRKLHTIEQIALKITKLESLSKTTTSRLEAGGLS